MGAVFTGESVVGLAAAYQLTGQADYKTAAEAVLPLLDEETILIASSDFTHFGRNFGYEPFQEDVPAKLRELADQSVAPLQQADFDGFVSHLNETEDTICGRGPIQLLLRILSMRGGAQGVRVALGTSGQMTGDWSTSVTYQSIVFTPPPAKLGGDERETLLELARETITAFLAGREPPAPDRSQLPEALRAHGASFVTLRNDGNLRGCIGNLNSNGPLYQSVIRNAVAVSQDFRFKGNPVTTGELSDLEVEVSYLTPLKRLPDTDQIVIGRDGLVIALGRRTGVLLPQVAYELGWSREEFLAQLCMKAGLPLDAWKHPAVELYSFEAEVFGELPKGHP